jgi:predicted signal transduction protein with EAL and GGDEF domain
MRTASIGIAFFPEDVASADKVLQCADMALYAVKGPGQGTHGFFDREVQATFDVRRPAIDRVRRAAAGCIVARSEPRVRLGDGGP